MTENTSKLPDPLKNRLAVLQGEIDQIISGAEALLKTKLPNPVQFEFKNSAVRDVPTEYERAQSISFITRFDHLPQDYTMQIVEQQGAYFTGDTAVIPHALNEFRELIQNEQDSVYCRKIHAVWYAMLVLDDPKKGTTIRVFDKTRECLPTVLVSGMSQIPLYCVHWTKYLYNDILQHSDPPTLNGSVKTTHRGNYIMCCGNMFIF